ncbi:DUF2378 family protein [Cystobacter ferrugineus]|uniref:EAL domain-containing protein n=1 Tax=Cystobacter ferrugineus TaxID=83449 RepID=A0A1L9BI64_9BACT|nr:DUF2378 family protein [Cystobacter ferrugineus]OJH41994.1 hypothetical protein BON30_01865 [Cystobacter ferrugineus]
MESTSPQARTSTYAAQLRIPSCVFEGLFVRGMRPDPALTKALAQEGYDPRCPEVDYPIQVWKRCMSQARYLAYGTLSDDEAYRALGRQLSEGFAKTPLGRIAAVGLPMMGPSRALERLPRYLGMMGRSELQVQSVSLGERVRRVSIPDIHNPPELYAGALEVVLEYAHAHQPIIHVDDRSQQGFRLLVRW